MSRGESTITQEWINNYKIEPVPLTLEDCSHLTVSGQVDADKKDSREYWTRFKPDLTLKGTRYRIIGKLGSGGMGHVYEAEELAENNQTERTVAIKVYPGGKDMVSRLRQGLHIQSQFRSGHIIPIYSSHLETEPYSVVMEKADFGFDNLLKADPKEYVDMLKKQEVFSYLDLFRWFHWAAEGLMDLHKQNISHCDIKPGNMFLYADLNQMKFSDLDLAGKNPLGGTVDYMSPEQATKLTRPISDDVTIGPKSDQYSLGISMIVMLTGKVPLSGVSSPEEKIGRVVRGKAVTNQVMKDVADNLPPSIRKKVCQVIKKMTAHNPDDRYETSQAMNNAILTSSVIPLIQQQEREQMQHKRWGKPLTIAAIGAAGLAVVGTTLGIRWMIQDKESEPPPIVTPKEQQEPERHEIWDGIYSGWRGPYDRLATTDSSGQIRYNDIENYRDFNFRQIFENRMEIFEINDLIRSRKDLNRRLEKIPNAAEIIFDSTKKFHRDNGFDPTLLVLEQIETGSIKFDGPSNFIESLQTRIGLFSSAWNASTQFVDEGKPERLGMLTTDEKLEAKMLTTEDPFFMFMLKSFPNLYHRKKSETRLTANPNDISDMVDRLDIYLQRLRQPHTDVSDQNQSRQFEKVSMGPPGPDPDLIMRRIQDNRRDRGLRPL